MEVRYGKGTTQYGPGVSIDLTGDEVATAVDAWLVAQGVHVRGPRTVTVNGALCEAGEVYVDPSGFVVADGERFSGRGPAAATPSPVASDALVQELVDTLKPFAELARFVSAEFEDSYIASWAQPTVGNLRAAARLIDRIGGKQIITQKTVTVTAQVLITPVYRAAVGGDLQQAVARQLGRELGEQIMQHLPPPVLVPVAPEPGSLRLEADQPNFDVFDARYEASVTFVVPK